MSGRSGSKRSRRDKSTGASGSQAPQGPASTRLIDDEAQQRYNVLIGKNLIYGRIVNDHSSFDSYGLNVYTLLKDQGLERFLAMTYPVYPVLVREFYANLRHPDDETSDRLDTKTLFTRVNGQDIVFTEESFAQLYGLPTRDGLVQVFESHDIARKDRDYEYIDALHSVCEQERNALSNLKVVHLKLPCRVIHRVVTHNLHPRSGSYEQVSSFDLYLIHAIWTRKPIDWAGFFFAQLKNGIKRKDSNPGYAIALSHLFVTNNAVFQAESIALTHTDYFNESTIQRFGFEIKNGMWVAKQKKGRSQEGSSSQAQDQGMDNPQDIDMDAPPPPMLQGMPTNQDIMLAIQGLSRDVHRLEHQFKSAFHFYHPEYVFPPDDDTDV